MKSPLLNFSLAMGLAGVVGVVAVRAQTVEPAWALLPDGSPIPDPAPFPQMTALWMSTGNNVRGVAANPVNGNVLVADTSQNIHVLDSDGNEMYTLNRDGVISGGLVAMAHVRVADDGVVFAANVSGGTASAPVTFRVWRWEDDSNPNPDPFPDDFEPVVATLAWEGDPSEGTNFQRWGDSFDVKGSGVDTKLVFGARNGPVLCILDTEDGVTFTPHILPYTPGGEHLGVSFGPDLTGWDDPATPGTVENLTLLTVFAKRTSNPMYRIRVRTDTWSVVESVPYNGGANPPAVAAGITAVSTDPEAKWLAGVAAAESGTAYLYNIDNPTVSPAMVGQQGLLTANANLNGVAAAAVFVARAGQTPGENGIPEFNRFYALNVNNGVIAYDIVPALVPPEIVVGPPSGQPANTSVLAGWRAIFSVTATGTAPLSYQWLRDGEDIENERGSIYILDPVTPADDGAVFSVRVQNAADSVTSNPATLTVLPRVDTEVMTPAWQIPVGQRAYVDINNAQRGLAHNPVSDHLLLVNRSSVPGLPPPPHVIVLNAATGAEILDDELPRVLRMTDEFENPVISGGTFPLNMIDCDAAGVVYAANLAEGSTVSLFTVYRWQDDDPATPPTVAYGPADVFNSDRCGDQLKVRGSGVTTQFLVGARNQEKFAIFSTADGLSFEPQVFEVPGAGLTAFFQCDFGAGDTIWAKTGGGRLIRVAFDRATGTAAIEEAFLTTQFPAGVSPIGVDPTRNLLGAVHIGENPNNLRLYDATRIGEPGGLLDLEFFPTDNPNGNGTGTVEFGANRIYALDTNNGIIAMVLAVGPPPAAAAVIDQVEYVVSEGGDVLRFRLTGETGTSYRIDTSTSLSVGSWTGGPTVLLAGTSQLVEINIPAGQLVWYFRAVTLP